jgi:hypothetical protein
MRNFVSLAALAATFAVATPAVAQQVDVNDATAKGTVLLPLSLSETEQLDFGTVIASTTLGADADVVIDPATGTRTISNTNVLGVATYPGGRGVFQGAGTAGRSVLLTLTAPALLTSGTNTLVVNSMSFDGCGPNCTNTSRTIDLTGAFTVGVGGSFLVAGKQANGLYTASYTVTADYQ